MNPLLSKRFSAYCIDIAICFGFTYMMLIAVFNGAKFYLSEMNEIHNAVVFIQLQGNLSSLFALNLFSYFFFNNYWREGNTIGCLFCDVSVVSSYGPEKEGQFSEISLKQAFIRSTFQFSYLLMASSVILAPALFIPFFRKDRYMLGDLLSKTFIVHSEEKYDQFFETEFSDGSLMGAMLLEYLPAETNILPFPTLDENTLEVTEEAIEIEERKAA